MTARDEILAKVKQALGRRDVAQAVSLRSDLEPPPLPPQVESSPLPQDALVEQFAAALRRVGGRFSVAAAAQAGGAPIAEIAAQGRARKTVGWHSPRL